MKVIQKLQVGSRVGGHFVFATEGVEVGQVVCHLRGDIAGEPSRFSIQVGMHTHLVPDIDVPDSNGHYVCPWIYTNHSCAPNTRVQGRELVAIKPISTGDEVTFDYETTEWDMAEPFQCLCGSPDCRKEIRGYKHLTDSTRRLLGPGVCAYLIEEVAPAEAGSTQ